MAEFRSSRYKDLYIQLETKDGELPIIKMEIGGDIATNAIQYKDAIKIYKKAEEIIEKIAEEIYNLNKADSDICEYTFLSFVDDRLSSCKRLKKMRKDMYYISKVIRNFK